MISAMPLDSEFGLYLIPINEHDQILAQVHQIRLP